ncbi:MAG: DNA oxidative demethylase AlkB [Rhodospirillaceae bacterium]|nr:DNA oxidative demethylase AlkB [Rhodospirillaceae bacterium]
MSTEERVTSDLFPLAPADGVGHRELGPGAILLRAFALPDEPRILAALTLITHDAPFRHMVTRGGFRMSVAMTNCGTLGWVSDRSGYRYAATDPGSGRPWPEMPPAFADLAARAAALAGFAGFSPDVCLINRYEPGARLALHQDRDERDFDAPIVSVSLGATAVFLFGGLRREDKPQRLPLRHGDVVVWGGPARLRYHGVLPLRADATSPLGVQRINLTFRRAG